MLVCICTGPRSVGEWLAWKQCLNTSLEVFSEVCMWEMSFFIPESRLHVSCCAVELNLWLFLSPHTTSIGWIPLHWTQGVGQAWWDLHSKSVLVLISNGEPDTECCVHSFGALSDQAKMPQRIQFLFGLVLSTRIFFFSLLVLPHWRGVCGLRHQKPSTLRRMVLFNQTLTKKCCLDKLPKVKVTKRILSSRL